MKKMKNKLLYLVGKFFYYMLPKFIRAQYDDSANFYIELFQKIKTKVFQSNIKITLGDQVIGYTFIYDLVKLNTQAQRLLTIENRTSTIHGSKIYTRDSELKVLDTITESVLDIHIFLFNQVSILGSTDALIYKGTIYHQELLHMQEHHDLKRGDIFVYLDRKKKDFVAINVKHTKIYDNENSIYISLLKEHSINYYHWITENIPRLVLIAGELDKQENQVIVENKNIVLLVDDGIPQQCLEMIEVVFSYDYSIQKIKKGELCQCNNLIYCSALWQSLDNTKGILDYREFFVDNYAIELVHNAILDSLKIEENPHRKIYLRRKPSQLRTIINYNQIETYMRENNFEIIETDKMSFKEQVVLFAQAKLVVGASGAAFTNILFMQPKTKAIIFYPDHLSVNHGIFQPLAGVAGIRLIHFQTIAQDLKSVHSNFFVDLHRLESLLMLEE